MKQGTVTKGTLSGAFGDKLKHAQSIRLTRFYYSISIYIMLITAIYAVDQLGVSRVTQYDWVVIASGAVLINLSFYLIFTKHFNLKFKDPSLTNLLIMVASMWGAYPVLFLAESRALFLILYLPVFSFGVLRFDRKEYCRTLVFVMLLYMAILVFDFAFIRPNLDWSYELLLYLIFGAVLTWVAYFGGLVAELRRRLKANNDALRQANTQISKQTNTDELTQLANRRFAMRSLTQVHSICTRYIQMYSLVMIDIDHFKMINDEYGHPVGDQVLVEFAQRMSDSLRGSDFLIKTDMLTLKQSPEDSHLFARFGGEEFVVVLPSLNGTQAKQRVERLQELLRSKPLVEEESIALTFSAGVAEFSKQLTIEDMMKRADQALYRAKKQGRDRVIVFQSDAD